MSEDGPDEPRAGEADAGGGDDGVGAGDLDGAGDEDVGAGASEAADTTAAEPPETGEADGVGNARDDAEEETVPFEGLSDEGLLLLFAGLACVLAALTAAGGGQPQPVVVFGAAAGGVALVVFAADLVSGHVPALWVHLVVGAGAAVAGAYALVGRHWLNAGTFGVAAALVLWRVVDVEYRGAE